MVEAIVKLDWHHEKRVPLTNPSHTVVTRGNQYQPSII